MFIKTNQFIQNTLLVSFLFIFSITTGQEYENLGLHTEITHVQPMTGIVFWTDNTTALNALGDKTQLEFSYLIFSDVIQEKDIYDWSVVDALLDKTANNGRQAILRFRYTYPGETTISVPNYIINSTGYNNRTENVEGNSTFIPDWTSTALQDFTKEFFTKFAERYDNDPRLAFVQIGFGSYSEYHLYNGPTLGLGNYFPSKAYQTTFLNHVDTVFENTQWSLSIDAASDEYSPIAASSSLINLSYGLFDDSFLHSSHSQNDTEYNRESWLVFGPNRADSNVAGGELNYYTTNDQVNALTLPNGPNGISFETLAAQYSITYMIGNDQFDYQTTDRIQEASLNTGYHFKVTSFQTNGTLTNVTIMNTGLAPIYYDAYPTANTVRASGSLKGLIGGQSKTFTINTVAINEGLAIESDRLVNGQEIQFEANLEQSSTLTTNDFDAIDNFAIAYPNPFKNEITIKNPNGDLIEVFVYNIAGSIIQREQITKTGNINTSSLSQGTYLVKMIQKNTSKTNLFIKK